MNIQDGQTSGQENQTASQSNETSEITNQDQVDDPKDQVADQEAPPEASHNNSATSNKSTGIATELLINGYQLPYAGNIWRGKILANTHFLNFWMVKYYFCKLFGW